MGLDVGTVEIGYLARPDKPTYDFLWHLNLNADQADWNSSAAENTFVEFTRDNMLARMNEFAADGELTPTDVEGIRSWIDGLPWRGDVIMLHLSW